jgi:hypothetical protein
LGSDRAEKRHDHHTGLLLAAFLAAAVGNATAARAEETARQECKRDLVHCIKSLNSATDTLIACSQAYPEETRLQSCIKHLLLMKEYALAIDHELNGVNNENLGGPPSR